MDEQEKLEFEISQYLDGQLSRKRSAELEDRLQRDPALREVFSQYASLVGRIAKQPLEEPEIDYAAQRAEIIRTIERRMLLKGPPRRRILRPIFAAAAAAAAILIITTAALLIYRHPTQPAPSPVVEVAVLPDQPEGPGQGTLSVELKPLDWEEVDLASPEEAASPAELPAGTVLVSVGPPTWRRPAFAYPIPMEF